MSATSPAILLPVVNPSHDMKSVVHLRANKAQTLYYEQTWDDSVTADAYRATVNYQFDIPSIVFDHTSLIYIVNLTNQVIVLGFGSADAFVQALGWPQTGIAMLIKGECVTLNANDVLLLNGFIYDTNALTVAANFTPSQISNISSNINVTFGRNDTANTNTSGTGNPQPYPPDVRYVDASFFDNVTSTLDNTYYTNLNGSADSLLDNASGCYFNSLSQALLYDILDPRYYDDRKAYETLVNYISSSNQSNSTNDINSSSARSARNSRRISVGDLKDSDASLTGTHFSYKNADMKSSYYRRRRVFRSKSVHKAPIRARRFFNSIGDFLEGAVETVGDAFNTAATVVTTVAKTVAEVGEVVGTAIFGGVYEKSGQITIDIGYNEPQLIYSQEHIYFYCQECKVDGTIDLHGHFDFGKNGLATVLNEGFVEATGRIDAKAVARVGGDFTLEKGITLASISLGGIAIPGVFNLGPTIALEVGIYFGVGGDLEATFGAYAKWTEIYTKIDFKTPANSQSSGWEPNALLPQISFQGETTAQLGVYVEPKLELALDVLNGILRFAAGLAARCTAGIRATLASDEPTCSGGLDIGPYIEVELFVYAEASASDNTLGYTEYKIFTTDFPIGPQLCFGATTSTTTVPTTVAPTEHIGRATRGERT